jgi:hypothetical protein
MTIWNKLKYIKNKSSNGGFDVLTVELMKIQVFWDMMSFFTTLMLEMEVANSFKKTETS